MENEFTKKYESYLKEGLEKAKPLLLGCLIEYYGEPYREIITSRFNNTEFIFYAFDRKGVLPIRKTRKEEVSKSYKDICKEFEYIVKDVRGKNRQTGKDSLRAKNRIIYSTRNVETLPESFLKNINEMVFLRKTVCEYGTCINEEYTNFVFIPLFFANDEALIHEIIHAIMSQIIGIASKEFLLTDEITKVGLSVKGDDCDQYLEECITQIEASKICQSFKNKGGYFLDKTYYLKNFDCNYNFLRFMVEPFYEKFKDDIIHSRLTLNKNLIVNSCDKEFYKNYANTVNDCYKEYPTGITKQDYAQLSKWQLSSMEKNYLTRKLER